MTMNVSTMYSKTMSFNHDSCASIRAEDSFYLSVALTMAAVLALSIIIKLVFIASLASLNLNPKSNKMNQADSVESIVMKVSTDEVANILSYLPRSEIMHARVCKVWRDAAKKTIVPMNNDTVYGFTIDGVMSYHAATVMTTALPCLQQLTIGCLGDWRTYSVGEDPDEEWAAETVNNTMHDINLISNFSKLRILSLDSSDLNGRYPTLFNFPLLQKLTITSDCQGLKWDFEMLSGCPLLEELVCEIDLDESISSLRVLKNTLQKIELSECSHVYGNFMDLADFPRLKELDLKSTAVTGDIRHIGEDDFPSLATFLLPSSVIGGIGYVFQRISDVPDFMDAIYPLLQRTLRQPPPPCDYGMWAAYLKMAFEWELSSDSPDWYMRHEEEYGKPPPPFWLKFIRAGPRLGWCWYSYAKHNHCCQICWLDPEPNREGGDYEVYIRELNRIHNCADYHTYAEYQQPPTEEEYRHLFVND